MLSGACLCETTMLFWVAASVLLKCPEGLLAHLYAVAVLLWVVRGVSRKMVKPILYNTQVP